VGHHQRGADTWIRILYSSGIPELASPWLQVLVLLGALTLWFCAIAGLAVWACRLTGAKLVRTWIGVAVAGLIGCGGLVAAVLFGEIAHASGLGRDPWFLAYWVVLLFLSVLPLVYIFWRNGLLKE